MAVHEGVVLSDHISQNHNSDIENQLYIAVSPKHRLGDEAQAPCLRKGGQDDGVGLRHISRQKKRAAKKKSRRKFSATFYQFSNSS